jgi:plastocyanin
MVVFAVGGCPPSSPSPPAAPPAAAPPPAAPAPPAAPPTGGETPAAPAGFGTIKGHVLVVKSTTPPEKVTVTKDVEVCGPEHDPGSLKIGAGGALETCVVYLKGPAAPATWDKAGTYEIDQQACHYVPRVLIVPVGQTVTFKSSDPVLHNVQTTLHSFNAAVAKGSSQPLLCDQPGEFAALKCNVHPFMAGLLVVAENPWYVLTDATGGYTLKDVPAGTWRIFARHEVLGKNATKGTDVTVEPNKETVLDLKFE